jgi:hypothetical protein
MLDEGSFPLRSPELELQPRLAPIRIPNMSYEDHHTPFTDGSSYPFPPRS